MHRVLETDLAYWREENIDTCFSDSVKSLAEKLRSGCVDDIFFPQVFTLFSPINSISLCVQFNMLDLIEEKTVPDNCANFLDNALKEAKTPAELFPSQNLTHLK